MKKSRKWLRVLGFNATISAAVGVVLSIFVGGLFNPLALGLLVAALVFLSSNLVMLVWQRFRRHAKWNYFEGLAWALVVFVLAAVPCLSVLFGANGNWGNSFLDALIVALMLSAPVLLVAAFVPLGWKRLLEA
jgi:hypothetical protein